MEGMPLQVLALASPFRLRFQFCRRLSSASCQIGHCFTLHAAEFHDGGSASCSAGDNRANGHFSEELSLNAVRGYSGPGRRAS